MIMPLQPIEPDQNSLLDLKLEWLFIADSYRNAGDKLRAYEVAKDLFGLLGETDDLELLGERYRSHLAEWKSYYGENTDPD